MKSKRSLRLYGVTEWLVPIDDGWMSNENRVGYTRSTVDDADGDADDDADDDDDDDDADDGADDDDDDDTAETHSCIIW